MKKEYEKNKGFTLFSDPLLKKIDEAYDHFSKILHNNDILMVKGSNATGLNQFSKSIKKGNIGAL